jgi:hypothetical protein
MISRAAQPLAAGHAPAIAAEIFESAADLHGNEDHALEIARGIAAFMREKGWTPGRNSSGWRILAARALRGAGRGEAAARLVLLGSGLVRSRTSVVATGGSMWVLDLERLSVRNDEKMEMMLSACVSSVVESICHVWDESGGRGTLGLSRLGRAAARVCGDKRRGGAFARELRQLCRDRLAKLKQRRGWQYCPVVMDLDFAGAKCCPAGRRRAGRR